MTSNSGNFANMAIGNVIKISGSLHTGDNGTFLISAVTGTSISWLNPSGVADATGLVWSVLYSYILVSTLLQSLQYSTASAFYSTLGGKLTASTAAMSTPSTLTLLPGVNYTIGITTIYPNLTLASNTTVTDLVIFS